MRIAVMADRAAPDALVSAVYEESSAMLIVETDDGSVVWIMERPEDLSEYVTAMERFECEAVVCTHHIGQDAFEPLAVACITRYDGAGLPVMEAARRALNSRLELVREYEGGPGCTSGDSCQCGED
jgi:predicted Fe-Mo cluster-binding NifX family protein